MEEATTPPECDGAIPPRLGMELTTPLSQFAVDAT